MSDGSSFHSLAPKIKHFFVQYCNMYQDLLAVVYQCMMSIALCVQRSSSAGESDAARDQKTTSSSFVPRYLEGQSAVTIQQVSCGDFFTACLTGCLSVYLRVFVFVCLCVSFSLCLCVCVFVCASYFNILSACLSVSLTLSLCQILTEKPFL